MCVIRRKPFLLVRTSKSIRNWGGSRVSGTAANRWFVQMFPFRKWRKAKNPKIK